MVQSTRPTPYSWPKAFWQQEADSKRTVSATDSLVTLAEPTNARA